PSWLGIRFGAVPQGQREHFKTERGATMVEQVYPESPAGAAGLRAGDILLGPPGKHFSEPNQVREWTMTSDRDKPLALDVMREGEPPLGTITLSKFPKAFPALPAPPKAGDEAPTLASLRLVRSPATAAGQPPAQPPGPQTPAKKAGSEKAPESNPQE